MLTRRSRLKTRLALLLGALTLAAFGFATTGAQASCILNPIDGSCLNVCPPILSKFHIYCLE